MSDNGKPMIDQPVVHDDDGNQETPAEVPPEEPTQRVAHAAPFESFTKDQMVDHLVRVHDFVGRIGGSKLQPGTKATKDDLIRVHNNLHLNTNHVPVLPHVHGRLDTDADREVLAQAAAGLAIEGKLSQAEIRRLTQVVNNDFMGVKAELGQFASDMRSAKGDAIDDEFKELRREGNKYLRKVSKVKQDADDRQRELKQEIEKLNNELYALRGKRDAKISDIKHLARHEGIDINANGEGFTLPGETKARQKAVAEVNEMLRSAELRLEQQRLAAQKVILLSGITEAGNAILATVPDAHQLMVQSNVEVRKEVTA